MADGSVSDFRTVGEAVASVLTVERALDAPDLVAVHAAALRGRPYVHLGRGCPDQHFGFDSIGLVRAAVSAATGVRALDDLSAYSPGWDDGRGVSPADAAELLARWGLTEVSPAAEWRVGDVLVFAMPNASLSVLTRAPRAPDDEWRMTHAYWGRASVDSWVGPWWRARLARVFRLRAALSGRNA